MIAQVHFRNFKALRNTGIRLGRFNLLIGPNGSGKTSLIESLLRLRSLAALGPGEKGPAREGAPEIEFEFMPPDDALRVRLSCASEMQCDQCSVVATGGGSTEGSWPALSAKIRRIRAFLFDHYAIATPGRLDGPKDLASNAGNLAAVLHARKKEAPEMWAELQAEFCRVIPDFASVDAREGVGGTVGLWFGLANGKATIGADEVSQGTLYLLAILALAFDPEPPAVVCLEEADRGIHPRQLREVRDALYRLSHPEASGMKRAPVQVLVTSHSPYLLDLFRDHPEEVILANKEGNTATFERLSDRADFREILRDAPLGDLWYSGVIGGIPGGR